MHNKGFEMKERATEEKNWKENRKRLMLINSKYTERLKMKCSVITHFIKTDLVLQ